MGLSEAIHALEVGILECPHRFPSLELFSNEIIRRAIEEQLRG
jgi:hypothetical protein